MSGSTVGNQGDLTPLPANACLSDCRQNISLRNLVFEPIKLFILDKTDRVIAPNRALEQTLRVIREGRGDHRQRRHVGVPVFRSVRVGRPDLQSGTRRTTENDRDRVLTAAHITDRPGVVYDLIVRNHRKAPGHKLHHGP